MSQHFKGMYGFTSEGHFSSLQRSRTFFSRVFSVFLTYLPHKTTRCGVK
jgi:hypothetical protein